MPEINYDLGSFRKVENIQPGWLIPMDWGWIEVDMVLQAGPVVAVTLTDGFKFGGLAGEHQIRCITNSEKALRRQALESNP